MTSNSGRLPKPACVKSARWTETPEIRDHVMRLSGNGPRVLLEFLAEVGLENDCTADIGNRLAVYSLLTPEALQVTGGDRLVPWRPLLVPITKFPAGER